MTGSPGEYRFIDPNQIKPSKAIEGWDDHEAVYDYIAYGRGYDPWFVQLAEYRDTPVGRIFGASWDRQPWFSSAWWEIFMEDRPRYRRMRTLPPRERFTLRGQLEGRMPRWNALGVLYHCYVRCTFGLRRMDAVTPFERLNSTLFEPVGLLMDYVNEWPFPNRGKYVDETFW